MFKIQRPSVEAPLHFPTPRAALAWFTRVTRHAHDDSCSRAWIWVQRRNDSRKFSWLENGWSLERCMYASKRVATQNCDVLALGHEWFLASVKWSHHALGGVMFSAKC